MAYKTKTKPTEHKVEIRERISPDGKSMTGKLEATVWGTPLTPEQTNALLKKHRTIEWDAESKRRPKQRFVETDWVSYSKDRFIETVTRWDGFTDEDDNPLQCTEEAKSAFYDFNLDLATYIMERFDEIGVLEQEQREAETKNLSSGENGDLEQEQ